MKPSRAQLLATTHVAEDRGTLVAVEGLTDVPFQIARTFIVSDVPPGEARGEHAHYECEQFLVCLRGSVDAVADDGTTREVFHLDSPRQGLYLPLLTWGGQFNHSADAILLVLASAPYSPDDYIHDYAEYLTVVTEQAAR